MLFHIKALTQFYALAAPEGLDGMEKSDRAPDGPYRQIYRQIVSLARDRSR